MECDEETPINKPRIDIEEDVINLEQDFNFEFDSLKTMIEEELDLVNPTRGKVPNHMVIMHKLVVVKPTTTHSERNRPRTTQ